MGRGKLRWSPSVRFSLKSTSTTSTTLSPSPPPVPHHPQIVEVFGRSLKGDGLAFVQLHYVILLRNELKHLTPLLNFSKQDLDLLLVFNDFLREWFLRLALRLLK